ncbi:MAG: hypothetical protein IJ341_02530 [Bacteroidales bacterium]|nr:hypothetical protein [Bacteroidales bacterium]
MNERPKEKLSGVELFVIDRVLRAIGYSDCYSIIELDETRDGIRKTDGGAKYTLYEGFQLLSDILPSSEELAEEYWFNDPEIEIWNNICTRFMRGDSK